MPTLSVPRRNRRSRRKGANPPPVEREPSYVVIHASERELPPPDPATLPEAMRYQREKCYAWAMSNRFGEWLILLAARERVPMDNCLNQVENLVLFVEAFLLAAATWPHLCPQEIEDDGPDPWAPVTEADALEVGLTIRKPDRYVPVPMLPGCHGTDAHGAQCERLRRYGELFCPHHRRRELQRLRELRG
jgi:hypothetical protein